MGTLVLDSVQKTWRSKLLKRWSCGRISMERDGFQWITFAMCDVAVVVLWMVDFDVHKPELEAELVQVNLDIYSKLSPPPRRTKLTSLFNSTVDDEKLHIIAQAPGMSH